MMAPYSVLMSIYSKEKGQNLRECFDSLLNQSVLANEWVIVKDGPLNLDLEKVLEEYEKNYPGLINYVVFKENVGLGLALREGVQHCKNELIARMDTDDICRFDRMERQLKEFHDDPKLDICGSHIREFDGSIDNIISTRKVPLSYENIKKYQKRRSAFNHMTVMFKKHSVLNAGNYEHAPLMEDDLLWIRMLLNGCKGINIDDYLVFARTGYDMIERRGGFTYFKKYRNARKTILKTGYITYMDYASTVFVQLIISSMPKSIRKFIFVNLLR